VNKQLSYEYIRGLTEGEGTFTFSISNGRKVPAFAIKMHYRDERLLVAVKDALGLKNKIYVYNHQGNDGHVRVPQAILIVREIGAIKNVIIPLFYKKLYGNKAAQFLEWMEKIGKDPEVPDIYKSIYKIYKSGFYDKNKTFK
jgi:hypothetical protein